MLLGVWCSRAAARAQWVAVGLAALAVVVLTAAYGQVPWIALTLALSFATYGLMKNQVGCPRWSRWPSRPRCWWSAALVLLRHVAGARDGGLRARLRRGDGTARGAGVITAVPLLMFAGAAARIPLTTMGLLQYITPILQFLIGVLVVHEVMPPARWVGFSLVWAALVLFSVDSLRAARSGVRPATVATRHGGRGGDDDGALTVGWPVGQPVTG